MATRLLVIAHAPTMGTRDLVFADLSDVAAPASVESLNQRAGSWVCGLEPACVTTARLLGTGAPRPIPALSGPDFGDWAGRTLADVAALDPAGLEGWLSHPEARPHGGESLAALVDRVGLACEREEWRDGATGVVVTQLVARAIVVHVLGAPPSSIFNIDVPPLGRAVVSRSGAAWRLQRLDDVGHAGNPARR